MAIKINHKKIYSELSALCRSTCGEQILVKYNIRYQMKGTTVASLLNTENIITFIYLTQSSKIYRYRETTYNITILSKSYSTSKTRNKY
jgi:hypothetical protein